MAWVARPAWRVAYLLLTALVLALVWCSPIHGPALSWALAPIALAWLLMPLRLRVYSRNPEAGRIATPVMALAGQLMIASTLISIATLHALPNGSLKLLFVLFRSEEHTSELQSLMRISYAVFCLKKNTI